MRKGKGNCGSARPHNAKVLVQPEIDGASMGGQFRDREHLRRLVKY